MEIKEGEFLDNFKEQFEEEDHDLISIETVFRELEIWSSMNALLIIAMVEESYDLVITGEELKTCKTVADLLDKVRQKANS